jgi:acetyl esterase/lipase
MAGRESAFLLRAWPSAVRRIENVEYASPGGQPLFADLYIPENARELPPVIVWLHPGGWIAGDRKTGPDLSRFLAERGFAMVAVDYRLSRQAVFPAALEDVKSAIGWVRSAGEKYGFDGNRIGLWGASAGGHLAALAALSDRSLDVRAVVDVYGPTDFLRMGPEHRSAKSFESRFLGAPIETVPELVKKANPVEYAGPGAPPFLIVHGSEDRDVDSGQSVLLYEALAAAGNDATLCIIDGLGHGFLENEFGVRATGRVRLRDARPGLDEFAADGPPMGFGAIETFFRKWL